MRVRAIDNTGDWLFGKGANDYVKNNNAVAQEIQTRLGAFLGDCFFDTNSGIDWFNFLSSKNQIGLNLAITAVILNTPGVSGLINLSASLNAQRVYTVSYQVQTAYSTISGTFQPNIPG
jgi:hypothetical protein